jgi:ammonium transporter Rh
MSLVLTTAKQREFEITSDATSDRFSMVGSMILWLFWPSFCSAIVEPDNIAHTAINTILALCGATLAAYILSAATHGGKCKIADIANASLAGGVAIGSMCANATLTQAFIIGVIAGLLSVVGYTFVQNRLEKSKLHLIDTCGVNNLHGMPGILGGICAMILVPKCAKAEILGIIATLVIAIVGGLITGLIVKATGKKQLPYEDSEDFVA